MEYGKKENAEEDASKEIKEETKKVMNRGKAPKDDRGERDRQRRRGANGERGGRE